MMTILDEIRENLATRQQGAMQLESLPVEYPAFTIRQGEEYGVAIPTDSSEPIAEYFSSCSIHNRMMSIGNKRNRRYLILTCVDESLRYQFARFCTEFVDPGKDGENREKILNDPFEWWTLWSELLGNVMADHQPYSVIGEMMVLDFLKKNNQDVTWEALHGGTHDIESLGASYEVKSTIRKYEATVVISNQNQLNDDGKKRLYLYFVRLEASAHGYSIDDMANKLVEDGYERSNLEKKLEQLGYERGSRTRLKKYKCLERRKYDIDKNFPKITNNDFKDGKIPKNIVKIEYTINLNGLDYTKW